MMGLNTRYTEQLFFVFTFHRYEEIHTRFIFTFRNCKPHTLLPFHSTYYDTTLPYYVSPANAILSPHVAEQ